MSHKATDQFSGKRDGVHRMLTLGIIPAAVSSLNDFSRFMQGKEVSGYSIKSGDVMPPTLARGLYYYLDITQDASHSKDSLKLNVEQYVQKQRNVILLKTIVNIALDICLWFNKYSLENQEYVDNEAKWKTELYRGKAVVAYSVPDNKMITVCGQYTLPKRFLDQEVIIYGPCQESNIKECYCNSRFVTIIGHAHNVKPINE